ncbi:MAG: metal-dependent hydrolase [Calditrichaeota bacterium]|nr:metal-dependent hydrolase [Calditrichota bacterium]
MPTIITHSFVGWIASRFLNKPLLPRILILSLILPVLPDLDVISFQFGIPYEHFWGHRGFTHSLAFAALLGVLTTLLFFGRLGLGWSRMGGLMLYFFLITASHGVLDALTRGGLGIAFFSPFDNGRYFFPWRPIKVSPIGLKAFLSGWGARTLLSELLWVWLPLTAVLLMVKALLKRRSSASSG